MNKGLKILTGTLAAVVGAGAVGTACYYNVPSFKSKVNSALNIGKKTAEIKSGEMIDNPNEVKPISPEQFKTQYKVDLPTSFLGGQLFVKQLSNNNLLISSDIATGLLMYDVATDNVSKIELAYSGFKYFTEYDDLILFSSTEVSFFLNKEDYSCKLLSICVRYFVRLSTGNFVVSVGSYLASYYFLNYSTLKVEKIWGSVNSAHASNFYSTYLTDLGNDKFLLSLNCSSSSGCSKGLYYYDNTTMSVVEQIYSTGFEFVKLYEDDSRVILCSYDAGMFSFNKSDLSVTELITGTSYGHLYYVYTQDNISLFISHWGVYRYDIENNVCEKVYADTLTSGKVNDIALDNGNKMVISYDDYETNIYLLDIESLSLNSLVRLKCGYPELVKFSNGDLLIYLSQSAYAKNSTNVSWVSYKVCYFSNSDNTLKQLWSSYYADSIALDNGQLLFASYYSDSWSLYLFNPEDQSYKMVLKLDDFDSFEKQEDGTILINTGTGIDYEYDQLYESFRLVYNAN